MSELPNTLDIPVIRPYPETGQIEGIPVAGFPNPQSLFERMVQEIRRPGQRIIHYLNIHVANTAFARPRLRTILQESDLVYCDGAGIVLGAKLLGQTLPTRLTAADWFVDLLGHLARENCSVFLLGGEPGVPEAAMRAIEAQVPEHTIVGSHHGFILNSPEVEQRLINRINELQPDLLIVGFGTPLQEQWIDEHRHKLKVSAIYAAGAVMDFVSGRVPRCPQWLGNAGFEWLFRLCTEPDRLGVRYLMGNPWFLSRIATQALAIKATGFIQGLETRLAALGR